MQNIEKNIITVYKVSRNNRQIFRGQVELGDWLASALRRTSP